MNDDPDRAIRLLEIACGGSDARVLYSCHLNRLLNYLWWRCDARVESIIERMTSCGIEKVEEKGAVFSTVIELKKSRMKVVADSCARGNIACRRGVAHALAHLTDSTPDGVRAAARLPRFFDDEDATVAGAAAEVFRDEEVMRSPLGGELAMQFARSSHFLRDPNDLMWPLADFAGDLSPFQPALAHVVLRARTDMAMTNRDLSRARAYFADKAAECVLRIYERAQGVANVGVREWCLDQIDALVSAGDSAIDGALKKLHSDT